MAGETTAVSSLQEGRVEERAHGRTMLTVKPSQREAFAHRHRSAEGIYVVLSGSGRVKLDDELGRARSAGRRSGLSRGHAFIRSGSHGSRGSDLRPTRRG